jgi:hypothetical protein
MVEILDPFEHTLEGLEHTVDGLTLTSKNKSQSMNKESRVTTPTYTDLPCSLTKPLPIEIPELCELSHRAFPQIHRP